MKSIIITESLEVQNGRVVAAYSTLDYSNSNILNFGTAFTAHATGSNQINIHLDKNDPEGKTYIINEDMETVEKLNGTIIVVQYLALFDIRGARGPVIKTESINKVDKVFKLLEAPENILNLPPILNFGFTLVKNIEGLIYIPIIPNEENTDGKTATFPFENEEQEDAVLDNEMIVQYTYMSEYDTDKTFIVVSERLDIEFKQELAFIYLTEKPENFQNESPVLNFGTAQIHAKDGSVVGRCGVNLEYDINLDKFYFTIEGITDIGADYVLVQYTTLQEQSELTDKLINSSFSSENIGLTSDVLDKEEEIPLNYLNANNYTSQELGITPEMLEEARAKSENIVNNGFTQSVLEIVDDVEDADFTEVTE